MANSFLRFLIFCMSLSSLPSCSLFPICDFPLFYRLYNYMLLNSSLCNFHLCPITPIMSTLLSDACTALNLLFTSSFQIRFLTPYLLTYFITYLLTYSMVQSPS